MKKELSKITYYELRAMLEKIYECASCLLGKVAKADENTPEDILAKYLEEAKNEGRREILLKYKEIFDKIES